MADKKGISGTVILNCDCVSKFQDKTYGLNKRVHNLKKAGDKANCTGCGKTHDTGRAALETKKKEDKVAEKAKETKEKPNKDEKAQKVRK